MCMPCECAHKWTTFWSTHTHTPKIVHLNGIFLYHVKLSLESANLFSNDDFRFFNLSPIRFSVCQIIIIIIYLFNLLCSRRLLKIFHRSWFNWSPSLSSSKWQSALQCDRIKMCGGWKFIFHHFKMAGDTG